MKLDERREILRTLQEHEPFATGFQLLYRGNLQPFRVYEIPLDALIYNQYNGRIGSVVKSFEKQSHTLDPENPEDIELIEKFLFDSKKEANAKTLESLRSTGQIKFGIVTSDGVIIDGNRRASLMNKIRRDPKANQEQKDRCAYFKAVILPETAQKRDILQLETSFQMGEDEKVDYNPIEKYLKCKDLEDSGFTRDEIASFMGIKKSEVEQQLEILDLMDQYLAYNGYDGIYTLAEGHEDSFQKLNIALKAYKAGNVSSMWDYTPTDINNLLVVAFDYIRLNLPQSDIRDIFRKPSKTSGSIFSSKKRWDNFFEHHISAIDEVEEPTVDEVIANATGIDVTPCLKARDEEWRKRIREKLEDNFKAAQDEVDSQLRADAPMVLLDKALRALTSIDSNSRGFKKNAQTISHSLETIIETATKLKEDING